MSLNKNNKRKKKFNIPYIKIIKIFIVLIIMSMIVIGGALGGAMLAIAKDSPEIDPSQINTLLNENSTIVDKNGNLIEKIQTEEFRTIVSLSKIPKHLRDAFIAIEDERFESHIGIDFRGIARSLLDNFRADSIVGGASTINQQLARNLYLSLDQQWDRKIKEQYLAIQLNQSLTKDQILEAYLNRIYLGQGAYGVQEAAQTYFSKDVEDLSIAQAATLAGVVKSPSRFALYQTIAPEDFDPSRHKEVGQIEVLGRKYYAVYNEEAVERQKIVLAKMLELGKITDSEYEEAIRANIADTLEPGKKRIEGISSYFTDYVKTEVLEKLVSELGYSQVEAQEKLYTGGLVIYSTLDVDMQTNLEDIYDNFTEILLGDTERIRTPAFINWRLSRSENIIDSNNQIVYYKKDNLLDENNNLIIEQGTYEIIDGNLIIKNHKISPFSNNLDIADFYTIDDRKNLVTHQVFAISIPEGQLTIDEDRNLILDKAYLSNNTDFYTIDEDENLLISDKYFLFDDTGIVQPQSSAVIMDYRSGEIKALVGGRDIEGARILNRAVSSPRQPGSTIKPLGAYLPAIDNGFTAASPIDDIPIYNTEGELWPRNWYSGGYRGIYTIRRAIEQSANVPPVKMVYEMGVSPIKEYFARMGIIQRDNGARDNFVTREENPQVNDENAAALALGGMTRGLTALELTAAYGSIANSGTYIEPIAFTKILDNRGNVLLENTPKTNKVVSPQTAFIMSDMLHSTVTNGIASRARLDDMPSAGKTGTTQENADAWFVGYTPYYVASVWMGNDAYQIKLSESSSTPVRLWATIMSQIHENLERREFEVPDDIVRASICTQSGKRPTELCSHDPRSGIVRTEYFVKGTQPTEDCDVHVEITIDTSNNKIANEFCPEDVLSTRVFIERTPAYIPEEHNGIVPDDWEYTMPTEVCTDHDETTIIDIPIFPPEDGEDDEDPNGDPVIPPRDDEDDEDPEEPGNGNGNGNGNGSGNGNGNGNGDGNGN